MTDSRNQTPHSTASEYCSISEALKLIHNPFSGDKRALPEFIDNCDAAFSLVEESQHEKLLKFVKARIIGDAKSKLLVRSSTTTWSEVKEILVENYSIRRTVDYYACALFSARQQRNEFIADWGSRIDSLQSQLREATVRILPTTHIAGAVALIQHLAKASFVQGLVDDKIQLIVRSKDRDALSLGDVAEIALEQESNQRSAKEKSEGISHKPNAQAQHKKKIICHFCKKPGHIEAVCRLKQKQKGTPSRHVRWCTGCDDDDDDCNCKGSQDIHAQGMHDEPVCKQECCSDPRSGSMCCSGPNNGPMCCSGPSNGPKCFPIGKQGYPTYVKESACAHRPAVICCSNKNTSYSGNGKRQ
jgi:hypothetical protein